jgi:hypothetical protein
MNINRRQFNHRLTSALLGLNVIPQLHAQGSQDHPTTPSGTARPQYFFKHPTFEIIFLTSLGRAYHSAGNVGKVLYLTRHVEDGNFESAYLAFKQAGDEARALAEESVSQGHKESARQAYLWAQNFLDSATYFVDASKDPTRFLPTWELLYDCWLKALSLFDPPIEPVSIPYEKTELHGFFIRGTSTSRKRPLLILVNGSDGSLLDMWLWGGAGALARGYDCLSFDGPGQGYALWKQRLYFRPDWEKVISPVVDYALSRAEVDPKRVAIQGISQGGYLSKLLDPATKSTLSFRMRPFGFTSYYDTYKAVLEYNVTGVAGQIRCPMLITEPANESFWPGQSRQLYSLLASPKKLVPFTESDGADLHCEPKGTGLRDLRVFDWLDETLG